MLKIALKSTALASSLLLIQAFAANVTINKNFTNFDKITLKNKGELVLTQGPKASVKIIVPEAIVNDLDVYQSGGTVNLGLKKDDDARTRKIKYIVTMKDISAIKAANAGEIEVKSDIKTQDLTLSVLNSAELETKNINASGHVAAKLYNSGEIEINHLKAQTAELKLLNSGEIEIDQLTANKLHSDIKNSGEIEISKGKVDHQVIRVLNSGSFKAAKLISKTADITLNNASTAYANVAGELSADLSGSAGLYLYGKPKMNGISTSGSSKIHRES